ncbi:hypothetical protein BD626DRAFT_41884 [Schizophyllum amplum]|uniref:Uncharacterized protein n=1 Tax=Schizophyllum amplum TaxID=97359 RepID=A0A550CDT4_9AGAR|nr:hypothetical protein BD626DRAFT_41884 [Auriculariopsis ampla]
MEAIQTVQDAVASAPPHARLNVFASSRPPHTPASTSSAWVSATACRRTCARRATDMCEAGDGIFLYAQSVESIVS